MINIFEAAKNVLEGKYELTVKNLEIGFTIIAKTESEIKKAEAEYDKAAAAQEYQLHRFADRVANLDKKLRVEYRDMIETFESLSEQGLITKKHRVVYIDLLEDRIPVLEEELKGNSSNFALKTVLEKTKAALAKAKTLKVESLEDGDDFDHLSEAMDPSESLPALTKVLLSMKASYAEINGVREQLKKNHVLADLIFELTSTIARSTSVFNAFVAEYKKNASDVSEAVVGNDGKKLTNGVKWELAPESDRRKGEYYVVYDKTTKMMVAFGLTLKGANKIAATDKNLESASSSFYADNIMKKKANESVEEATLTEDKLQNDIKSLKKIGWKLDKVIPFLITKGDDYGIKMTSDLISMYYNDEPKKVKTAKVQVYKAPKWPKDPPASKINDPGHAESFLNQAIASEESPDMDGSEAYTLLQTAGYTDKAIMPVLKNLGWDGDLRHGQGGTVKKPMKPFSKFKR